jgi:hypothetical protein
MSSSFCSHQAAASLKGCFDEGFHGESCMSLRPRFAFFGLKLVSSIPMACALSIFIVNCISISITHEARLVPIKLYIRN